MKKKEHNLYRHKLSRLLKVGLVSMVHIAYTRVGLVSVDHSCKRKKILSGSLLPGSSDQVIVALEI